MASENRQGRHSRSPLGARKLLVLAVAGLLLWRGDTTGLVARGAGNTTTVCYTLTLNVGSGSGTVMALPDSWGPCPSGQYAAGYTVAVLATASPGYQWSSWSGTDNDSMNSTSVTMNADRTATAFFTSNCYRLTLNVGGGNGTVMALPGSSGGCPANEYPHGFTVAVLATAGHGYQWSSWSGTDNDSINSTTVTMNGDRTASALFTSNCYRLALSVASGNGAVMALPGSSGGCPANEYPHGFAVSVLATAGLGYQWSSWSGTDNDSINPTAVTMNGDRTASATFTSNCYRLTLSVASGNGAVMALPGSSGGCPANEYPRGFAVAVLATAGRGYQWTWWSGTDNDSINSTTVTMNGDRTATAAFVALGGVPPPTPVPTAPPAQGLRGDVDCDGRVTAVDAALVLQLGAGLVAHVACPQAADVNGDGRVNAVDAALILQFVAGLVSGF